MTRPLIITDCDEVLLHMMVPFRTWLDEAHHIHFTFGTPFEEAFRHKDSQDPVARELIWNLLGGFFDTEMHRQQPIDGALDALARLGELADIVVLTNLQDHRRDARAAQLAGHGLHVPVFTNQGGKGPAVARILAERKPSVTVFIDDLDNNHTSVAKVTPEVWRLHMVGEPALAPHIPNALDAHFRLDHWRAAEQWIADRIHDAAA
jgi:hypothetical protein